MRRFLVLFMLAAAPLAAGEKPLTIDGIFGDRPLDGRLPREVRWVPDGSGFSLLRTRGEGKDKSVELWVEGAPTRSSVKVLAESGLRKFDEGGRAVKPRLAGYRWFPDGGRLLLVGDGELFVASRADGTVRRLTATEAEEEEPEISPDGSHIAFVRDNDVWVIDVESGLETRISHDGGPDRINGKLDWVYGEELAGRHSDRGLAWSPDSRSLAYLSLDETRVPRFPLTDLLPVHPTVTWQFYPTPGDPNPVPTLTVASVVPANGGGLTSRSVQFGGSDAEYLPRFGWMPNGRGVWYEVMDRAQASIRLMRMDTATGDVGQLVAEHDPAWVNVTDDLRFLSDGRFVWSSERSGYRHLYLYGPDGTLIRQLTSGAWEVTGVESVDERSGRVIFQATADNPLERNLYEVPLGGGPVRRLTAEAGTHSGDVSPDGLFVLDSFSTAAQPTRLVLRRANGTAIGDVEPDEAPSVNAYALGSVRFVTVTGADGVTLDGMLTLPPDFDPSRRYPVVVYVYGGPHAQVVRDAWGGRTGLFHRYLASRGVLVFSLDNRGSAARGRDFERAILKHLGRTELEDQLRGVAWLKAQPFVDGDRLAIWGWSYGGFMTCYALANAPDVFRAGVAVAPVTDWRYYDSIYTERYMKLPAENEAGYRDSAPVTRAADVKAFLLLVHGTGDDNVHWQNTAALVNGLYSSGKGYDLQLYPNLTHGLRAKGSYPHLYSRIAETLIGRLAAPRP